MDVWWVVMMVDVMVVMRVVVKAFYWVVMKADD